MSSEVFGTAFVLIVAIPVGLILGAALLKIQGVEKE
jgi:hypothetical protein